MLEFLSVGARRETPAESAAAGVAEVRDIRSQRSWVIRNDQVELAVTERGAHMAPVTFYRQEEKPIAPYYVSPSNGPDQPPGDHPEVMRGDFFCLPFGSNATPYEGERHPSHGETARAKWSLASVETEGRRTTIFLAIEPKVRPGKVTRQLSLMDGENVVYDRTEICGYAGKTTLAHHAVLAMPAKDRALLVSASRFVLGMTCPYPFSDPAAGEYQSLEIGAEFRDLSRVPSIYKHAPDADCSAFPTRCGYSDLLQLWADPRAKRPAWLAAVNTAENYLWFALKDAHVLPSTIFWMENQGRHGSPWNGTTRCLGLEDGCMFFDKGIAESCWPNSISAEGLKTCHELAGDRPFVVTYIQGVVRIPEGFGHVRTAEFTPDGVKFRCATGGEVFARVQHQFLYRGSLEPTAR